MASILYLYMCYYRIPNYHLIFTWYIVLFIKNNQLVELLKSLFKNTKTKLKIVLNIPEEEE